MDSSRVLVWCREFCVSVDTPVRMRTYRFANLSFELVISDSSSQSPFAHLHSNPFHFAFTCPHVLFAVIHTA